MRASHETIQDGRKAAEELRALFSVEGAWAGGGGAESGGGLRITLPERAGGGRVGEGATPHLLVGGGGRAAEGFTGMQGSHPNAPGSPSARSVGSLGANEFGAGWITAGFDSTLDLPDFLHGTGLSGSSNFDL
jgi:hypothetical protein